ncbi:hypothetical protein TKK_0017442 [Trichogramma kaykai]|uniref:Uridine 5'-monophosphate synthase n=1 Tax=Trichogramma kaykai TaxID=54128 RepID=A0ABD2W2V9_9HYME
MKLDLKEIAAKLYDIGAIKNGSFTTKAGHNTSVYIDLRSMISYPELLSNVSKMLWGLADSQEFVQVVGVPYTALPIATVISTHYNVPMLIRRKETKSYGTKKMIEGVYKKGDAPILVDDILMSGSSIFETVEDLKKEGLNVTTALVVVDREQGAKEALELLGIKCKSLFTITSLFNLLHEAGRLDRETVDNAISSVLSVSAPLNFKQSVNLRLTQSFATRSEACKNRVAAKLFNLMEQKQTTLCLAADFIKSQEILDIAQLAGPHIAVLKIHVDSLVDFNKDFVQNLTNLAETHNFMIMEDRKFGDSGYIVARQYSSGIYSIAEWADLITVHAVPGKSIITSIKRGLESCSKDRGIFVVAQMTCFGSLTSADYIEKAVTEVADSELVAGVMCQNNCIESPGLIQLTSGVKLVDKADDLEKPYKTPNDIVSEGADLVVVGREIIWSEDQLSTILKHKKALWEAYEHRVNY